MADDILNLDKLMEEAREDLNYDLTSLTTSSLRLPILTEKYARKMMQAKAYMKMQESALAKVYAERHEFFKKDFQLKLDKSELDQYIKGDKAYCEQVAKTELARLQVEYIQTILNAIDKSSWNIGNAIKWEIFKSGGS